MTFYHGSVASGLTELRPQTSWYSNLKEPTVYLTTSRQLALHYIWDLERIGVKCPMLDIREDGTLVFQEMFSGALEYFYRGCFRLHLPLRRRFCTEPQHRRAHLCHYHCYRSHHGNRIH